MAGYRPIGEAKGIPEGTTADLLMDDGKVVRATWKAVPGTLGNCPGNSSQKVQSAMVAWWPLKGRWRGQEMIGLYEPLSFKVIAA